MRKRVKIVAVFVLMLLVLTSCKEAGPIRFGTAEAGGSYYLFGEMFSQYAAEDDSSIRIDVKETTGSAANLRLLSGNYIQMAVAQTDMIDQAVEEGLTGFCAVGGLYTEYCQIVVPASSGISSVSDLLGKRVSIGEAESGTEHNAGQILDAYGLSDDLVQTEHLSYAEAAQAMKSGSLDAIFVTAGLQTAFLENLAKEMEISFLPIDEKAMKILTTAYDFYTVENIPAGTYTGQTKDVAALGTRSVLLVSESLSEDCVYSLTKVLYEHAADLQEAGHLKLELLPEEAAEAVTIPFHPGAVRYYEEIGITVSSGM